MKLTEFLKTIYHGDRGCKSLIIDGWNQEVRVQLTCISRVRGSRWDFYTAEDLEDGFIVFEGVTSCELSPPGVIPNDLVNAITAEPAEDAEMSYQVKLYIDSVDPQGARTEVEVRLTATSVALEDAARPGHRIRD